MHARRRITPRRGTIIVDTNVLFDLYAPAPAGANGKRLFAVLPFLARHGFDIVIPEGVMFETTRQLVLPDGSLRGIKEYFDGSLDYKPHLIHPDKVALTAYETFFADVCSGKYPHVSIATSDQLPGESAAYLQRIKAFLVSHPRSDKETVLKLKQLQKERPDDMGDRVIVRHLREMVEANPSGHIYILSNDRPMLDHINYKFGRHGHDIRFISTSGLLQPGLEYSPIQSQWGLIGADIRDIHHAIMKERRANGHARYRRIPWEHIDCTVDIQEEDSRGKPFASDHPFAGEMANIAHLMNLQPGGIKKILEQPAHRPRGRSR